MPLRRQILTTEPIAGLDPHTPFTIDFSTSFYFHGEGPGLLLGMSDPDETPGFKLGRSDDWLPRLGEAIERRAPSDRRGRHRRRLGRTLRDDPRPQRPGGRGPEVSRFLYATGFSGHGFLMGPAVGEVMRDLYLGDSPSSTSAVSTPAGSTDSAVRPELNIV